MIERAFFVNKHDDFKQMKKHSKLLLVAILFLIGGSLNSNSQTNQAKSEKGKIGISMTPIADNDVFYFESLSGVGSTYGNGAYTLGLNYLRHINHWLELETGLEYSLHRVTVNSAPMPESTSRKTKLQLIEIPVTVRTNFLRYFFANAGPVLHFDVSKNNSVDEQTGLGFLIGVGAKYDFNSGFSIFVNPYAKINTLLYFTLDKYHERTSTNGVRIGVTYALP